MFRRCAGWLLMVGFALLLVGCPAKRADPGNVAQGKPPRPDLSGPDTALHSYWALIDWYQRTMLARVNAQDPAPSMSDLMATVAVGDVLESFKNFTPRTLKLERTVESIAREGPDTAQVIAHIRNSPGELPGLTPTPIELFERESGGEYRYLLRRQPDGWKVAEVWRLDESSGPRRIR
jgi:hypothetical protein